MSKEDNLIPIKKGQTDIPSKGGSTKSTTKKNTAKMREIKKRVKAGKLKNSDEAWLLERIENPKSMSTDMLSWIDSLKKNARDMDDELRLVSIYNQAHKTIHGEKHHNLNMNVDLGADDFHKRIKDKF